MTQNNINASYYPNPHSTPQIQQQYQPPQYQPQQQQQQQPIFVPNSQSMPQNPAQMLFNNPMLTSMAVDYSTKLADEGKAYVAQNVNYINIINLNKLNKFCII